LERDEAALAKARQRSGRFILATNAAAATAAAATAAAVLEEEEEEERYTNDELLKEYKAQQSAQRGFRFLKDPLFFTSSIFVKTPERVAALAMMMGLCLLVYTLGQRALREALKAAGAKIRHQRQASRRLARP
jgi:transposase